VAATTVLMMGAESTRNMYSVLAVVNKKQYCPKLHLVGSLYIIKKDKFDIHGIQWKIK